VLVDRLKINGSLARRALADLEEKGTIKKVVGHSKLAVYSKCYHLLSDVSFELGGMGRIPQKPFFSCDTRLTTNLFFSQTARAVGSSE